MSDRERAEAEARKRYPDLVAGDDRANWSWKLRRDAFTAGRTVTAEQVEAAAKALWEHSPFTEALEVGWDEWSRQNPAATEIWKEDVRFTLTAAGLLIEGDE